MSAVIYDQTRHNTLLRFNQAVRRAGFLTDKEKINWYVMGVSLTNEELQQAERVIINEDLRILKVRGQLQKIKPVAVLQ